MDNTLTKWVPLTLHIREEMDWLRKLGFPAWTTEHVQQFLRGISTVGSQNTNFKTFVNFKTDKQVQDYSKMFWSRFTELKSYSVKKLAFDILKKEKEANGVDSQLPEKIPDKIYELDCLDSRLESQVTMRKALSSCDSMRDIVIPYSENLKEEGFCKEIDQFLVWKMTEVYGSDPKGKLTYLI